jgi:hypothetical protein
VVSQACTNFGLVKPDGKPDVDVVVGDGAGVNRKIADALDKPLVVCECHTDDTASRAKESGPLCRRLISKCDARAAKNSKKFEENSRRVGKFEVVEKHGGSPALANIWILSRTNYLCANSLRIRRWRISRKEPMIRKETSRGRRRESKETSDGPRTDGPGKRD